MSADRFTLDTNVLVYVLDNRDPVKHAAAGTLLRAATERDCWLTNQALAEFFVVTTRKLGMPAQDAAAQVRDWLVLFPTVEATRDALQVALEETEAGRFAFWDALLLSAAEQAGCTLAFSEDMHDGARIGDLSVVSPFSATGVSPAASNALELDNS